jgi:hypothetical protein
MSVELLHTWHVRVADQPLRPKFGTVRINFKQAGFSTEPLPGPGCGVSVRHRHPGAMTLFILSNPEVIDYFTILEIS